MHIIRQHLVILRNLWSTSLAAEMEYRANFVMACVTSLFTLLGALLSLKLLYRHGYEMGGWSWPEALAVVAVYTILDGIQGCIMTPNRTRITEHVRNGTLDFVLLKPIDSQFWLSLRTFSPWGLPNVILGAALMVYAGGRLGLGVGSYLTVVVPIVLGAVILYSVGFLLATLTIWFVKLWNITMAMSALLEAGRYPVAAYPLTYRVFFTFVLPVAFMTTVPAQAMIGRGSSWWLLGLALAACILYTASRCFWKFALRSYTSASS